MSVPDKLGWTRAPVNVAIQVFNNGSRRIIFITPVKDVTILFDHIQKPVVQEVKILFESAPGRTIGPV
jgi:hypothetical protein